MQQPLTVRAILTYSILLALVIIVVLQKTTDYKLFPESGDIPLEEKTKDNQGPQLKPGQQCIGAPIYVDYTYPHPENDPNFTNPWECQVQCEDEQQQYIYYANGAGTQCEPLPGCLDLGEDQAITCTPPKKDIPTKGE